MDLTELFKVILSLSFMGSVIALIIILIKGLFKERFSAIWHYYIWILLVIRLIMPYAPESSLSIFNILPLTSEKVQILQNTTKNVDKNSSLYSDNDYNKTNTNSDSYVTNLENQKRYFKLKNTIDKDSLKFDYKFISMIWLIGVIIMLFYTLAVDIKFHFKINKQLQCKDEETVKILDQCKTRMNIYSNIPIVYDKNLNTPSLFGLIRPKLLIPFKIINTLSEHEKKYIFLHELTHLKRKDILINWMIVIVQALHWFNPIIWYAFYKMREDCEVACDAYVLSKLKSTEHKKYGETIINLLKTISKPYWIPVTTGMVSNKSTIKRRIKMIAMFKKNAYKWSIVAVTLMLLVGCVGLTNSVNDKDDTKYVIANENISVNKLLEYKDSYVGDNSAVGNILANLPGNKFVQKFSLETNSRPYGIEVYYGLSEDSDEYWNNENTKKIFLNNATILFMLVKNVDEVKFNLDTPNKQVFSVTKEEIEEFYGKDLKKYAQEIINSGENSENFFKNHDVLEISSDASNIEKTIDEKLESIASNPEVANSSNPYEYIKDNKDYDFITNQGEKVLKHILLQFENTEEDGIKEYVMAAACCDILGENVENKTWNSGRKWYESYMGIKDIKLYFSDEQAEYVMPEIRKIKNPTPKSVVEELIKGPTVPNLYKTMPEESEVIDVEIKDKIAYVNFTKSFEDAMNSQWSSSAVSTMVLNSLVNTLTLCDEFEIDKVQVLIEGEKKEVLGPVCADEPFCTNTDYVKE